MSANCHYGEMLYTNPEPGACVWGKSLSSLAGGRAKSPPGIVGVSGGEEEGVGGTGEWGAGGSDTEEGFESCST